MYIYYMLHVVINDICEGRSFFTTSSGGHHVPHIVASSREEEEPDLPRQAVSAVYWGSPRSCGVATRLDVLSTRLDSLFEEPPASLRSSGSDAQWN